MRFSLSSTVARVFVTCWIATGFTSTAMQLPEAGQPKGAKLTARRELPSGAIRVINQARHGARTATCAEEPGPPIEDRGRLIPRTRVWVDDGVTTRQVGTALWTCDPAWSPDGERVAVVAPNGLWVLSADLKLTVHLVDTRESAIQGNGLTQRTLSRPQWAPDASRLAFLVSSGTTSWVEVVEARTGQVIHTSDPETNEFRWGADSESIHFGQRVVPLPGR